MLIAGVPLIAAGPGAVNAPAALAEVERGARLLILADASRAPSFRQQAPEATILTDLASLDGMEAQFDAAIVDGLLERERWDRWVLQRVHRALRTDAHIVVVVPPLISVASATDLPFLAYASKQILRSLLRRWRPGFDLPGPAYRRYHLPLLVRKMESAGFAAIEPGPGWPEGARFASPALFAQRAVVSARKASGLALALAPKWPASAARGDLHSEQNSANAAACEAWLSANRAFRSSPVLALEPSLWREARVLVLSPHPDDELIGCGGTLCRVLSAGASVCILQATDGSRLESLCDVPRAGRKTIRLKEATRVASALGARLVLWGEADQRLRCSRDTIGRMARLLRELQPTHIFTPFIADRHADHRALSRILAGALAIAGAEPQVLQYEVWSLVPANLYCDITQEAPAVERLLLLYERALQVENFVDFCHRRNLAHGLALLGRPAQVEAFLCTPGAEYRRLVERSS